MATIEINNINLGGISDSELQWRQNSVFKLKGVDIHSEPWILKVNQAMKKEYDIDEFVIAIVPCSDGNTYMFGGETGKIYKRESSGNYLLEATNTKGKIMDAVEFEDYIYYSSGTHLGRWHIGTAWSTRDDDFWAFSKDDPKYHPLFVLNAVLYVWDGNLVAQVEDGIFSQNALDLPKWHRITALGKIGNELLVGSFFSDNINKSHLFRWNTWSESWTSSDIVYETGVNSFLSYDNYTLIQCGKKGNIYSYDGNKLYREKRIPGNWKTGSAIVRHNASDIHDNLPLWGVSHVTGTPLELGIYSYGSYSSDYPNVLNFEYPLTPGEQDIEIWAIRSIGDLFLVSWKKWNDKGIDILDVNNKQSVAVIESRKISFSRLHENNAEISIAWRNIPNGWDIKCYIWDREVNLIRDEKRKILQSKTHIAIESSYRCRIELISSWNFSPECEALIIKN